MQRSSSSIGALASALAKAQAVLVNPEKSLVATIRSEDAGGTERSFRYASLASGLDIVRKTLGEHDIATVQTTQVDQGAGIVNLTTVLAHSSGEWIASDWPVCPISDTAAPHRMGAALTYARRYSLFTLVGIAGEDDLDAPDLQTPRKQGSGPVKPIANGRPNGGRYHDSGTRHDAGHAGNAQHVDLRQRAVRSQFPARTLEPKASVDLRERLLAELGGLGSSDEAATWAHRSLPGKNQLTAADAQRVEEAFQAQLATLAVHRKRAPGAQMQRKTRARASPARERRRKGRGQITAIDKAVLSLPEPRRLRDRDHVRYVAKQPCLVCGREPCDPHHLRFTQVRALGRKVSDEFTVPLCRGHHREVHRYGDETAWWQTVGIDPTSAARALWLSTHPLPESQGPDPQGLPTDSGQVNSSRLLQL